ncbi:MAG: hypothetical protein KTR31_21995 [Myxococcales bacterium]|nr:hypothetical protein [Myxococcales bacterium]
MVSPSPASRMIDTRARSLAWLAIGVAWVVSFLACLATYHGVKRAAVLTYQGQQELTVQVVASRMVAGLEHHIFALRTIDVSRLPTADTEERWLAEHRSRLGLTEGQGLRIVHPDEGQHASHRHAAESSQPCPRCASMGMLVFTSSRGPDGRYLELASPSSSMSRILEAFSGWVVGPGSEIVAHYDQSQIGTKPFDPTLDDPALTGMLQQMEQGSAGAARYAWEGDARLAAFAPVAGTDGWSVAVSAPTGVALGPVSRSLRNLALAMAALLVGLPTVALALVAAQRRVASERLRAEREVLAAANVAAHTDRLAQLGALTAGVAHDIRSPLTALKLGLEELAEHPDADQPLLGEMGRAVEMLTVLSSDLTGFSRRPSASDAEQAELRAVFRSTTRMVGGAVSRVEFTEPPCDPVAIASVRLVQILSNLADNALAVAQRVVVTAAICDGYMEIRVEDDGPGVPEDMKRQVFEPFFTTKPVGEGTGLGLHLSRRLAQEAGGDLSLQRSSLGGAAFVLRLPLWRSPPDRDNQRG